jgi:threonine dehydratase
MNGADRSTWEARLGEAAKVVRAHLAATPLISVCLEGFSAPTYLKLESLQPTGSFKVRGALAAVAMANRDKHPVVTASAGNHGLGIAIAATWLHAKATIVLPETASTAKIDALRRFDVDLRLVGEDYDTAEREALRVTEQTSARFVSAYSDPDVIAGQATVVAEIAGQLSEPFTVVVPVGGGGLASGIAIAAPPGTRVVGVEASASRAVSSAMAAGHVVQVDVEPTIADGLSGNVAHDAITPMILTDYGVAMTAVDEGRIHSAVRELALRHGIVAEGSAAVGVAAALAGDVPDDRPAVLIITGRNIAADRLASLLVA